MPTFRGIEGARAWLAWTVVLAHVVALTGLREALPQLNAVNAAGDWAVSLFIIISGFVITNLVMVKHEPYPLYIGRRLLRIYPAYLAALAAGIFVLPLGFEAMDSLEWRDAVLSHHYLLQAKEVAAGHLGWHLFWHALLLHGAIPNDLLDESEYFFLTPAWSISLEWQFYLLAPLLIRCLSQRRLQLLSLGLAAVGYLAYRKGLFGEFSLPSFLPGSIGYFLVGIGTRLAIERIGALDRYPTPLIAGAALLALGAPQLVPLFGWLAIISYALLSEAALRRPDLATSLLRRALDSRLATQAGLRSYSVYIVHWVIVNLVLYLAVKSHFGLSPWQICAITLCGTLLLTIASSELLYRLVEKPGIALGRQLGRKNMALA
jgi:peptidoglycan/LPS O-acetylase OafA/YrhL